MEAKNAGLYANLFYYNGQSGELEFVCAGEIDAEGNADITFTHASDYTIVIDVQSMAKAEEEPTVPESPEHGGAVRDGESEGGHCLSDGCGGEECKPSVVRAHRRCCGHRRGRYYSLHKKKKDCMSLMTK